MYKVITIVSSIVALVLISILGFFGISSSYADDTPVDLPDSAAVETPNDPPTRVTPDKPADIQNEVFRDLKPVCNVEMNGSATVITERQLENHTYILDEELNEWIPFVELGEWEFFDSATVEDPKCLEDLPTICEGEIVWIEDMMFCSSSIVVDPPVDPIVEPTPEIVNADIPVVEIAPVVDNVPLELANTGEGSSFIPWIAVSIGIILIAGGILAYSLFGRIRAKHAA